MCGLLNPSLCLKSRRQTPHSPEQNQAIFFISLVSAPPSAERLTRQLTAGNQVDKPAQTTLDFPAQQFKLKPVMVMLNGS